MLWKQKLNYDFGGKKKERNHDFGQLSPSVRAVQPLLSALAQLCIPLGKSQESGERGLAGPMYLDSREGVDSVERSLRGCGFYICLTFGLSLETLCLAGFCRASSR